MKVSLKCKFYLPATSTPSTACRQIMIGSGPEVQPFLGGRSRGWIWRSVAIMIGPSMALKFEIQALPFRKLPRQNELFLQYLERSPRIAAFYSRTPEIESLKQAAQNDIPGLDLPRSRMAQILRRQNASWGNDEAALDRIDELEQPGSVAILTGQQVGLFTGPLYTIYKAMTALRLAGELRNLGIIAVPIFWMDAEDHDLAEVTRLTALDHAGALHSVDCRQILFGQDVESSQPVGSISLPEKIGALISEFLSWLTPSPWVDQIRGLLESTYSPGTSFSHAFAALMARLFRSKGLVLFDPRDPQAKSLVSRVFRKAVLEDDSIHAALAERSRELENAGFSPQVAVQENASVLFLEESGGRRALITRNGARFAVRNTSSAYDPKKLLSLADRAPERFSPNVLLRPIVQDHLFPTVAYVGGPAEVSYFAQIETLYRLFGRPMPVIWPRSSLTVLPDEVQGLTRNHGLSFLDLTQERSRLLHRFAQTGTQRDSMADAARLREEVCQTLDAIKPGVAAIDPTLGPAVDTVRRKMLRNVTRIENNVVRLERQAARSHEQVDFLLNSCLPNGRLQEREMTVLQLIALAGPPLLEDLYHALRIEGDSHYVVWVSEEEES